MEKLSKPYTPFENIQYCGAKTRTTNEPCRGSAMKNGRCRMHGGKSTGRPVSSGLYTKEMLQHKKVVSDLIKVINVENKLH